MAEVIRALTAHHFWIALLGAIALLWLIQALRLFLGMRRVPHLGDAEPPCGPESCPRVSILFAARNEAASLPQALPTHLAQDYPSYDVIAVDDRSRDATARILDEFARSSPKLKVVHVQELPSGWLGKPHALWLASQQAAGEWLVFTDADVRFAPGVLRTSLTLALKNGWDHVTALPLLETASFWEKCGISYFVLGFVLAFEPWKVSDPRSSRYLGVGAFQLVRRAVYEAVGGHRRLALEIADDTKLGRLIKQGGFRSGVAYGEDAIRVRWQVGLRNLVGGLTKNFFAACHYSLLNLLGKLARVLLFSLVPFLALAWGSGAVRWLAAVGAGTALVSHLWATMRLKISPLYALTHPLGGALTFVVALRSTALTLWRGGVEWRETFYPLGELRRGMV